MKWRGGTSLNGVIRGPGLGIVLANNLVYFSFKKIKFFGGP
jgi:hypothetical protein